MTNLITGYQWGDNMHHIGVYMFSNNLDKEEIHMPPNTTLIAPPLNIPAGKDAIWNGNAWDLADEILLHAPIE
jgi:hypothetical protein